MSNNTEISIRTDDKLARDEFGQILTQVPEMEKEFAVDIMEMAVDEIRRRANQTFDEFDGNLSNQINKNNINIIEEGGSTTVRLALKGDTPRDDVDYIQWHEQAESGHWVKVSADNRPIRRWVEQQDDIPNDTDYIKVQPQGPFVKPAMQRVAELARQYADQPGNAVERNIPRKVKK